MTTTTKNLVVALTSCTMLVGVVLVFWYEDMRYSLPTPKPKGLQQKPLGETIVIPASISAFLKSSEEDIVLLHFFNPDCPCSKFNIGHVQELVHRYKGKIRVIAVVQAEGDVEEAQSAFDKLRLSVPAYIDSTGNVAQYFGVYSTPQAVLLSKPISDNDAIRHLYYRGNYNTSRYCTNPATEFVRIALDSLLHASSLPQFSGVATTAYGCTLPVLQQSKGLN